MFNMRNVVMRLAALGAVGAVALGTVAVAPSAAAAAAKCPAKSPTRPPRGSITNYGDYAFGVFHFADGVCGHGTHDAILYPGQDTFHDLGWSEVAGAYIGPGYWAKTTLPGVSNNGPYYGATWIIDPYKTAGDWLFTALPCRLSC